MSTIPQGENPPASRGHDWDDGALWAMAARLGDGDMAACDTMMADLGSPAPFLLWKPDEARLPEPILGFLLEWWHKGRGASAMPPPELVDPLALRPALGHLSLLEVEEGGRDFRYRIYGSLTAHRARCEWTGRKVSGIDTPMRLFFLATYRAVARRPQPLLTTHTPPIQVRMTAWHRLILPLGEDGAVRRLLVAILPAERQDAAPSDAPLRRDGGR